MKTFKDDFDKFLAKIKNHESFAVSRNNDGEMIILNNQYIDIRHKCNGEFIYNPREASHAQYRLKLLESAQYKAPNYYVGIACRCCVGDPKHEALKKLTGQSDDMLTWGNIFVNGNYNRFANEMVPEFSKYNIVMVANHKADVTKLPFADKIVKTFRIGTNAWMDNYGLIEEMKSWVQLNFVANHLFLFAAGPFSNILILELSKINNNNTYLDIGSTLDSMMNLGATRGYLKGADTLSKVCIW